MSSHDSTSYTSSISSGAVKSRLDTISKYFTLIMECVEFEKVWPHMLEHIAVLEGSPYCNIQTMKDLLLVITQKPGSPLYGDFMQALSETYTDFYDQIHGGVVPTCSVTAEYITAEETGDHIDTAPNNIVQSHQHNNIHSPKASTKSSSRTASSPKSSEITKRERNIIRIFETFGEELNEGDFVNGFLLNLPTEDASSVLHGKFSPSKELFHILQKKTTSKLYHKFINYLHDKKPSVYEDIFVEDSNLKEGRGIKRVCENAEVSKELKVIKRSGAMSQKGTMHDDRTAFVSDNLYGYDRVTQEGKVKRSMKSTSPMIQGRPKYKCQNSNEKYVETEQPHVCLTLSKEVTMAHVIESVRDQIKGTLQSFSLSKHNVSYEDAFQLGQLLARHIGLEDLSIEDNFMTTQSFCVLIEPITCMHRLVYISIFGQSLSQKCCRYLQQSLKHNVVLGEMRLDNCRIDAEGLNILSSVLNKGNLKILSLNDNGFGDASLGKLMDSLSNVKDLKCLSLDRNGISDAGCVIAGQRLAEIDTAFTLSLEGNQISDKGALSLVKILHQRSGTCALNLAENQIGNDGAQKLVEVWEKKEFSGILDLKGNQISGLDETGNNLVMLSNNKTGKERADILVTRIMNGEVFSSIALKGMMLQDDSMKTIATSLYLQNMQRSGPVITDGRPDLMAEDVGMSDSCKLTEVVNCNPWSGLVHLNVSNNALTSRAMHSLAELVRMDNLQSLNIGRNNFKSTDFSMLSEALQGNKSLNELLLKNSKITDEGAFYISLAMKNCMSLRNVDLEDNEITATGCVHISEGLKVIRAMGVKAICENLGKDSACNSGARHLTSAIKEKDTIQCLNLRGNKLCDNGLIQLSGALALSDLQALNVSKNGIGPGGAMPFLSATAISNLRELDMSDNPIAVSFAKRMHQFASYIKQIGRRLKVVHLRNTKISDTAVKNLMKGTRSQTTMDLASNDISDNIKIEIKEKYGDKVLFGNEEY